ncbi:unnamed protein product [Albugo candida]|uniref:1,3-beta-glucan synthase n=1 Tax=Albugo candida TaxID=65357 RepID=A0A024GJL4_9STRA|nr:unnamed protein product [Albugo candida]|eukprot:CCI47085.1 unnamed protein product [Albugo candida]
MRTSTDRHARASSNYFELNADRRRASQTDTRDPNYGKQYGNYDEAPYEGQRSLSQRLSMLEDKEILGQSQYMKGGGLEGDFDDETSIDYCCEILYNKFGFQSGSVNNQREHVLLLLANGKARTRPSDPHQHHIKVLHTKLVSNYIEWCQFLRIQPNSFKMQGAKKNLKSPMHMDMMLLLLIWGEAANLRHMPECICYIFHQMLHQLNQDPCASQTQSEGWYLRSVVSPVWAECANMKRKNKLGKSLEHVHVRNYDDINEYFWKPYCIQVPIDQIGKELSQNHGKSYYEHRSIFTLILNYYRIFQFNLMFLTCLVVIGFISAVSPSGGKQWFAQFGSMGQVVAPYTTRDVKMALISIVFSHSMLAFLKTVLEAAHGWHLLFNRDKSTTSSRSFSYASALVCRMVWNAAFAAGFGWMIYEPLMLRQDTSFLNNAILMTMAFITPATGVLLTYAIAPHLINDSYLAQFTREGVSCYVGRHMAPPFRFQLRYIAYWLCLWSLKAFVSYFILVRPLVLPSLAIYSMQLKYGSNVINFHNMGVILALWAPIVFIFNYDTQIYFTAFQALLGWSQGIFMKTGEIHGMQQFTKYFRAAPPLFDHKIVTALARANDATHGHSAAEFQSQMMLRFVVVWNEIVNSFREGDLVDDKEAAILQYDVQSSGEVFEPVFLSAGKLNDALEIIGKLGKEQKGDEQLHIALMKEDCLSGIRSFFHACMYVFEALLTTEDADMLDALREIEKVAQKGKFMATFDTRTLPELRASIMDLLEAVMDLPDPEVQAQGAGSSKVHSMGVIRSFVNKMENLINNLRHLVSRPDLGAKFSNVKFVQANGGYMYAMNGLTNLFHNDAAMGAATRAYLLMTLDRADAMPRCGEAQRRLGFFLKSLVMEIPELTAIKEMKSFSVVTPFYSESVLYSLQELSDKLDNPPIFRKVEEDGKNITILKYLTTIHPAEWENFLERVDVMSVEEALSKYPMELRLWASYRGQTLARTVQGMMLYEDAIKILHWLEIGSAPNKTAEQKQSQLEDIVRLKFSYICACQVYGKHRAEGKAQADDIDYLLKTYPNLRVAYVDTIKSSGHDDRFDSVLIKSERNEIVEVYRYELPGDPILGEGKPENQNNALQFTRGEYLQTIDMNQQHYFEECLKMPQLLATADLHPSKKPVSIIGMREHIFTGDASSLSKFKSWQELVFVTLSQRVLADPLYVRMHYGHPDVFDKLIAFSRGGVSKASKGINLSEDVFAGFNSTLRGGIVTHVEFMQCGKGRDVALSQISMFEGKLANGAGETSLAREAHRMGQFMDFFRLNSMYYSHTGFYFATWMTIVTTFVYMYSKVYLALSGVQREIVFEMNSTQVIRGNVAYGFDLRVFTDVKSVMNTQFFIQAGLFLMLPLMCVYFGEGGLLRGFGRFLEMIITGGPAFFVFQVGTTMHFFDNNIVHGGANYQATGRGFKITRETFVLLYRAYASSHYRKAFELVGLCLVYLAYGNFSICQNEAPANDDFFAVKFCTASQGYGVQTFSTWFIAILWLLSPFIFNTDGLDWQKTKVDIKAWVNWMFADADYKDDDKTITGGWVTWWKSELEQYHNSNMIARITVIIRESRHFFVMFYVITLKTKSVMFVAVVLAAAGATVVAMGFIHGFGLCMRGMSSMKRASFYAFCLLAIVSAYLVAIVAILHKDMSYAIALFFGYMAALYGLNECARTWSFSNSSIAGVVCFQQLAFFFDYIFGLLLVIPLFIMSCIPFLNIIQTRMMYNEGFSKVMSASSQYALSIATFIGLLGGIGVGWLFSLLSTLEQSPSFSSYVITYDGILDGGLGRGKTSYVYYIGCVLGVVASAFTNHFLGRRLSIVIGGLLTSVGMTAVYATGSSRHSLLIPAIGILGISTGVLFPSLSQYIYEVPPREMRSRTMLLLGFGITLGVLLNCFCSTIKQLGWIWEGFIASGVIGMITAGVNIFPESPLWVLEHRGWDCCEACLIVLRRKPDVSDELKKIREEGEGSNNEEASSSYKLLLGISLMITCSLATPVLNTFIYHEQTSGSKGDQNRLLLNCLALQITGAGLSFFFIDKLNHKSILFGTCIPVALCAAILGFDAQTDLFAKTGNAALCMSLTSMLCYFFLGLGFTVVPYASAVGLFTTRGRAVMTPILFAIFFVIPIAYTFATAKDPIPKGGFIFLYGLTLFCIMTMVLLMGAGTRRNGILCTKEEMAAENERYGLRHQSSNPRLPSGASRNRNINRSRGRSNVINKSNYQRLDSPATGREYGGRGGKGARPRGNRNGQPNRYHSGV